MSLATCIPERDGTVAGKHSKKLIMENAPRVCPPPARAKDQGRQKKTKSNKRQKRVELLTRPTASSLAKAQPSIPEEIQTTCSADSREES